MDFGGPRPSFVLKYALSFLFNDVMYCCLTLYCKYCTPRIQRGVLATFADCHSRTHNVPSTFCPAHSRPLPTLPAKNRTVQYGTEPYCTV